MNSRAKRVVRGLCWSLPLFGAAPALAQSQPPAEVMPSPEAQATATPQPGSSLSSLDQEFVQKAAQGGLSEVQLGKLAVEKASDPNVKAYGQRMIDDHTKINDRLKSIADHENIQLPTQPSPEQQQEYNRLSKLSGKDFDRTYINMELSDHKNDIAEFQKEAKQGKDPQLKRFARETLPILRQHETLARQDSRRLM